MLINFNYFIIKRSLSFRHQHLRRKQFWTTGNPGVSNIIITKCLLIRRFSRRKSLKGNGAEYENHLRLNKEQLK